MENIPTIKNIPIRSSRLLRGTLWFIAGVQIFFGSTFLLAPEAFARLDGLHPVPGWANWMFGMMAARFLGYGYGMAVAARRPEVAEPWVRSMMVIQAIDWIATAIHVAGGDVTLAQVSSASFLPLVFIVLLALGSRKTEGPA